MADNNITYQQAVEIVKRKLNGEAVNIAELRLALAAYPQIGRKLSSAFEVSPPEWASSGLSQMETLRRVALTTQQQPTQLEVEQGLDDLKDPQAAMDKLFQRSNELELGEKFLVQRLLPRSIIQYLLKGQPNHNELETQQAVTAAANATASPFGLTLADIFGQAPLSLNQRPMETARFKLAVRTNKARTNAYTVYAHFLALLTLETTQHLVVAPIPTDEIAVREAIISKYGEVSFENALRYVWSLGVAVLPLNDAGAFHGACWRNRSRNIIVLKQKTQYQERWLFDLLHELRHASEDEAETEFGIVEEDEIGLSQRDKQEEKIANRFAWNIELDGRASILAEQCVKAAGGNVARLKAVVPEIALLEGVSAAILANYLAFRLSNSNDTNWWGTAKKFQTEHPNPLEIARKIFLENVDLSLLNEVDRNLLLQALSDGEV